MKLAAQGFTITFVNTQSVHCRISRAQKWIDGSDIFAGARDSGLDIRYATVSDGFPLGFDRSLNHDQFVEGLIHVFSAHVDELVANLADSDPPVTCLIADTFYVWASAIAEKHNLVSVSFWTEPALVLSLYYHLDLLKENGHFGSQGKCLFFPSHLLLNSFIINDYGFDMLIENRFYLFNQSRGHILVIFYWLITTIYVEI